MGVNVQRSLYVRVAELILGGENVNTCLVQHRGISMSELMRSEGVNPDFNVDEAGTLVKMIGNRIFE